MDSSAAILLMIVLGGSGFAALLWSVPLAARSLFAARVSGVRDDVVDAELRGELPPHTSVYGFVKLCDNLLHDPQIASLSFLYAFRTTRLELGEPEAPSSPYIALPNEPREFMQAAEGQLVQAMAVNMTWGSIYWLPLTLFRWVLHFASMLGQQVNRVSGRPTILARELARSSEGVELTTMQHGLVAH